MSAPPPSFPPLSLANHGSGYSTPARQQVLPPLGSLFPHPPVFSHQNGYIPQYQPSQPSTPHSSSPFPQLNYMVNEQGRRISPRRHQRVDSMAEWLQREQRSLDEDTTEYDKWWWSTSDTPHNKNTSLPTTKESTPADHDATQAKSKNKTTKRKATSEPKEKKQPEKKVKGKGSRSGKNARGVGASDDEIQELSVKDKKLAALPNEEHEKKSDRWTEDEREKLVRYITDDERYPNFKINQARIFQKIVDEILTDKTVDQVRRCWNTLWAKYKACRRRELHTGGGDGDEEEDPETEQPMGPVKRKKTRKEGDDDGEFSKAVLDTFELSEIYDMIDRVAHFQEDVVRQYPLNSHRKNNGTSSDNDEAKPTVTAASDPGLTVIEDAFRRVTQVQDARIKLEERRLMLDEQREKREAERACLEAEKARLALEEAQKAAKAQDIEQRMKLWNQYHTWKQSGDALLIEQAELLAEHLKTRPMF